MRHGRVRSVAVGAAVACVLATVPALAADALRHLDIVLLPLAGHSTRTIRLASRPGFPRPQALRALERVIRSQIDIALPRRVPLE